jgi:hypothetical protein
MDGTLMMWTAATGHIEGTISAGINTPCSMCASSDGKYFVSGHNDGTSKVLRVRRGSVN